MVMVLSSAHPNSAPKSDHGCTLPAGDVPFWKLSPVELRVGAAAVGLSLVARWHALLPLYSADDYRILYDQGVSLPQFISQGRLPAFALQAALAGLGVTLPQGGVLGSLLLMVALAATGIAVCRLWGVGDRFAECAVAVLLIVLHPYQAEVFTFRVTPLFLAIPLLLSFAALLTCMRSRRHWLLALAAIVCSLGIYQVVLNYIAMALLFSVVFHLAAVDDRSRRFWRTLGSQVALVGAGIVASGALTWAASRISGIPLERRGGFIGFRDIGPRSQQVWAQLKVMFFGSEAVLPVATKLLLLALLAVMMVYVIASERKAAPARARAFALAMVGGVPLCVGAVLVLQSWWPALRVLAQTGMFWGGMFALVCRLARPAGRRVLFAGLFVILFSFIGLNDVIFNDQLRLNMHDIQKANRIVARIEALPGFEQIQGVVISGGFWAYASPIRTIQGSALYVPWSKVPLLNEATGYRFLVAPPDVTEKANGYCKDSSKWPAAQSVIKMDSFAVVCLAG
jgi:hypothetical protein